MKKINYVGSLRNDLKKVNKEGRILDIALNVVTPRLIALLIAVLISIPIYMALGKITNLEYNWTVSTITVIGINAISMIRALRKDFKERKEQIIDVEYKIQDFVHSINLENEDAINLVPELTYEGLKEAVTKKKENKKVEYVSDTFEDGTHKKVENRTTTDFYFLDNADKLRVLREIRKEIKEKKYVEETFDLYFLDDEDIPSDVPVVRSLERK